MPITLQDLAAGSALPMRRPRYPFRHSSGEPSTMPHQRVQPVMSPGLDLRSLATAPGTGDPFPIRTPAERDPVQPDPRLSQPLPIQTPFERGPVVSTPPVPQFGTGPLPPGAPEQWDLWNQARTRFGVGNDQLRTLGDFSYGQDPRDVYAALQRLMASGVTNG